MPIGKNSIKRITGNGYSNVQTTAPDMENSTVAQIPVIDLTGEIRFPIQIGFTGDRFHDAHAVHDLRIGVIQRIDIHRQAQAMLGNPGGVGNKAEVEGR